MENGGFWRKSYTAGLKLGGGEGIRVDENN